MSDLQRRGGQAAIAGALLAIAGNAVVLPAAPAVSDDRVSYPLSTHAFQPGQVFFAFTQALTAAGIVALVRSEVVRPSHAGRVFGWLAVIGMALTVPGELALISVAHSTIDAASASAASTLYGVAVLLADIGLIGFGVLALRQRRWPAPWRLLPLLLGLFQLLVVTPVSLSAGFATTAAFVVITVADLLTAGIGLALVREPWPLRRPHHPRRSAPSEGGDADVGNGRHSRHDRGQGSVRLGCRRRRAARGCCRAALRSRSHDRLSSSRRDSTGVVPLRVAWPAA
jgi:hypothetical protein